MIVDILISRCEILTVEYIESIAIDEIERRTTVNFYSYEMESGTIVNSEVLPRWGLNLGRTSEDPYITVKIKIKKTLCILLCKRFTEND